MNIKNNNFAYIDGANLHSALKELGWIDFDYARFRVWLTDKYAVDRAYIFIGLIARYKNLYKYLQEAGFNDQRSILNVKNKKAPGGDGTPQGSFS